MGFNTRYNVHRQLFFSVCTEDPAAINAAIFTALQHLGHTDPSFANAALFYKSKLLQTVRDRFSDPIQRLSPATTYCVAALLTTTRGLWVRVGSSYCVNLWNSLDTNSGLVCHFLDQEPCSKYRTAGPPTRVPKINLSPGRA
jgi:hypothetical protein